MNKKKDKQFFKSEEKKNKEKKRNVVSTQHCKSLSDKVIGDTYTTNQSYLLTPLSNFVILTTVS